MKGRRLYPTKIKPLADGYAVDFFGVDCRINQKIIIRGEVFLIKEKIGLPGGYTRIVTGKIKPRCRRCGEKLSIPPEFWLEGKET